MDTDKPTTPDDNELAHLRAAFETFNQVSGDLQSSYSGLQSRVIELHRELRRTNELREAEAERARRLAKRLAALLEALPGGVVMLDEGGVVREINAAALEYLGEPLRDHEWSSVCRRAFAAASDERGDLVLRDGRTVTLAQKALQPGPGQVMLLTDVTEDRKLEQLLSRHRRLAAMGEMAAALAHQIRTPLSAALLYLSNATGHAMPREAQDKMLAKATQCLRDLEQLITDMLQFARGSASSGEEIDVDALLRSVSAAVMPLLRDEQTLNICAPRRPLRIAGNREALSGALINLLSNALTHGGERARVKLSVDDRGIETRFTVTDNGPGIDETHAAQRFDPFFTTRADGTGLGLAVVRSVARAHGGDVRLTRNSPRGAVFTLSLPQRAHDPSTSEDAAA